MKLLPSSLLLFAALCFFIVAALKEEGAGVWIVIGCAMLIVGIATLKRARSTP